MNHRLEPFWVQFISEDDPVRPEVQLLNGESRHTKRAAIVLGMVLAWCPGVFAQNPSLDISQYAHTRWEVSKGFCKGVIRSIAQTLDGYLWVATDSGLFRFDGVRAVPWEPPAGEHLPGSPVTRLLGGRDGTLWIGALRGLASWKAGKLTHYPELEGQRIEALLEDREGTIWAGGWAPSAGTLCSIQSGNAHCDGRDGRLGSGVTALYEDGEGNLWAGAMDNLWRWKPGPPKLYSLADPAQVMYALTGSDDGGVLIARRNGITKLKHGVIEAYPLADGPEFKPASLLRDRHGRLWIGAVVDKGLLHIHDGRTDPFTPADGL
jgi:ligand-binding sensor domain-containing protein